MPGQWVTNSSPENGNLTQICKIVVAKVQSEEPNLYNLLPELISANYLFWRRIRPLLADGPAVFRTALFEYDQVMSGVTAQEER